MKLFCCGFLSDYYQKLDRKSRFYSRQNLALILLLFTFYSVTCAAQNPEQPNKIVDKDYLLFSNGEKLIGTLERSTGDNVVFKSDMAGEVSVKWSSIKELHTRKEFAVIQKGTKLRTDESDAKIPRGPVSVQNGAVTVTPHAQPQYQIPLQQTADMIDQGTFARVVLSRPAWYQNWRGVGTVGLAAVRATQTSQTYTSAVNFVRDIPGENWMDPENRTTLSFTSSFGQLAQPNTPTVKTSIFHAMAERDRYFSPREFLFANAQFDHDYSQGLDLQQIYSTGVGFAIIKSKNEELDLRAAIGYEDQKFFDSNQNQHLIGSIFSETYNRKFKLATLQQNLSVTPSWSNLNAYSATAGTSLTMPIFKKISFTVAAEDGFLNNPSPTFRKNSFQFSSGITYQIK